MPCGIEKEVIILNAYYAYRQGHGLLNAEQVFAIIGQTPVFIYHTQEIIDRQNGGPVLCRAGRCEAEPPQRPGVPGDRAVQEGRDRFHPGGRPGSISGFVTLNEEDCAAIYRLMV